MRLELESLDGSVLDHAIALAGFGFKPVFIHVPIFSDGSEVATGCSCGKTCGSKGKHPILRRWQAIATSDPIALREQRSTIAIEEPNLGVVLGAQTGGEYVVAIDVDDRDRFEALLVEHGELPDSVSGESGRGSRIFYALSPDVPLDRLRNITGLSGAPGVDVKASGGQVVVAPSMHESGKRYTWTRGGEIALLPPTWAAAILPVKIDPPKWISEYTPQTMRNDARAQKRAEKYLESAVMDDARLIASCQKGLRNTTLATRAYALFSLCAGTLYLGGSSWDYVRRELYTAGLAAGLPSKEVTSVIDRAEKKIIDEGIIRVPVGLSSSTTRPVAGPMPVEGNTAVQPVAAPVSNETLEPIKLEMDRGAPARIAENVARLLAMHPIWNGGPAWDTYSQMYVWPKPIPQPVATVTRMEQEIVGADYAAVQGWIMSLPDTHRVRVGRDDTREGLKLAARRRRIDLLRLFVERLPNWDRVERLPTWAIRYLGCPDTPYVRATGRAWIVACVERALAPGIVIDVAPVLEGNQGTGKNRALNALFEGGPTWAPWLTIISGHNLDKTETLRLACTRWVLHDDEFQGRTPKKVDALKSWASRTREEYRIPWDPDISVTPRRALLVVSTNKKNYLHDPTGNRRWWPWRLGKINIPSIRRDREQLFAEAFWILQNGGSWRDYLSDEIFASAHEETEDRRVRDPIVEQIEALLTMNERPQFLTTTTIALALGFAIDKIDRSLETRIGEAMQELGYECSRPRGMGRRRLYELVPRPTLIGTTPNPT